MIPTPPKTRLFSVTLVVLELARSTCLCLLSAGIKSVCYHHPARSWFLKELAIGEFYMLLDNI